MTTASQVKSAASKAAKAAQQAAVKAGQLANDPNKIDSFILRVLVWGLLLIPLHFFWENRTPYTQVLAAMLGLNFIVEVAGVIMVSLVQYLEVRPFTLKKGTPSKARKRSSYIAAAAYVVDVAVCSSAWPIFATKFGMPQLDDILWINIGKIISIVCGFSLWFALRRLLARKA